MAREIDSSKTRRALRRLKQVRAQAEAGGGDAGPRLTEWERAFVEGVGERLETYGSAFRDPAKGRLEEALSDRQAHVVKQLTKKTRTAQRPAETGQADAGAGAKRAAGLKAAARGSGGSTLKRRTPLRARGPIRSKAASNTD